MTTIIPHTGSRPNYERRDRVKQLYRSGLSVRQIAKEIGVSFQAVHSMLERMGIPRRQRGGNTGSHSRHR